MHLASRCSIVLSLSISISCTLLSPSTILLLYFPTHTPRMLLPLTAMDMCVVKVEVVSIPVVLYMYVVATYNIYYCAPILTNRSEY